MQQDNRFTPPGAELHDHVSPGVPRAFKVLLVVYFVLTIAGVLMSGQFMGLVLPVIMAVAVRSMFKGNAAASRYLGVLFAIAAVMNALAAWGAFTRHDAMATAVSSFFAVYTGILVAYIFFNPALQAHFVAGAKARWAGH
jgi:hypothetical protein